MPGQRDGIQVLEDALKVAKYEMLVQQLNKDLARAGLRENYPTTIQSRSLLRSFTAFIYELVSRDMPAFLNLLYAVDVPEKAVNELAASELHEFAVGAASLILNREFMKLKYR
ncbi:MAG: hypothetical protein CL868_02505 [Cytophagaceae bacterium]|nr:hypothetical protein [Cytophagaceae bacterium]|tara:strand:- start:2444 stop:2782 length:339 start_codon:yes stop_codon:yes gene_type:complete